MSLTALIRHFVPVKEDPEGSLCDTVFSQNGQHKIVNGKEHIPHLMAERWSIESCALRNASDRDEDHLFVQAHQIESGGHGTRLGTRLGILILHHNFGPS